MDSETMAVIVSCSPAGTIVEAFGLTAATGLNGQRGLLIGMNQGDRVGVEFHDIELDGVFHEKVVRALRPANLKLWQMPGDTQDIEVTVRLVSGALVAQLGVHSEMLVGEFHHLCAKEDGVLFDPLQLPLTLFHNDMALRAGHLRSLARAGITNGAEITAVPGNRLDGRFRFFVDSDGMGDDELFTAEFSHDRCVFVFKDLANERTFECTYELLPRQEQFSAEIELTCVAYRCRNAGGRFSFLADTEDCTGQTYRSRLVANPENYSERGVAWLRDSHIILCDETLNWSSSESQDAPTLHGLNRRLAANAM